MLDELESELAQLYKDISSARRVVDYAGLPANFIEFDGPIIEVWHRIVIEADKRGKLPDLLSVAIQDYPERHILRWVREGILVGLESASYEKNHGEDGSLVASYDRGGNGVSLDRRITRMETKLEHVLPQLERMQQSIDACRRVAEEAKDASVGAKAAAVTAGAIVESFRAPWQRAMILLGVLGGGVVATATLWIAVGGLR